MSIKLYEVNPKYIDYLLPYAPHLFQNKQPGQSNERKYIGIVLVVNGMNYFAAVYRLYARKQDSYYVNKVTGFGLSDLRSDLIDRARKMSRIRNMNHPWLTMGDEELLRSAGLILKDDEKHREGITLAAILLFGEDITIMSAIPQHKTDALRYSVRHH